jgi:hypothetical protein
VSVSNVGHFDYGCLQMDVVYKKVASVFELSFSFLILSEKFSIP